MKKKRKVQKPKKHEHIDQYSQLMRLLWEAIDVKNHALSISRRARKSNDVAQLERAIAVLNGASSKFEENLLEAVKICERFNFNFDKEYNKCESNYQQVKKHMNYSD